MNSRNEREENSETIPLDLNIEILTRLPTKSIARFRCVSKLWESTLRSPIFTESFFAISSSRPKILFTCRLNGKTFFFTSPQTKNSSSSLTAGSHLSFPINYQPIGVCRPVCGLVCGLNKLTLTNGDSVSTPLICNPSTGQSLPLPKVKTRSDEIVISYLAYDPIDKQFKVLCMTLSYYTRGAAYYTVSEKHQVLTLGTGKKLSWQRIICDLSHIPVKMERSYDHICINGVLYYFAWVHDSDRFHDIVCFGIRSEEFKCIRQAQRMGVTRKSILVNYKGKLAMLQPNIYDRVYTGIQLWVLKDAEKHQWSSYIYVFPPPWEKMFENKLHFVGTTSSGEIVLSSNYISDSFYLLYYNLKRKSIIRVEIQGMEAFKYHTMCTFLDHVEDLKLMAAV